MYSHTVEMDNYKHAELFTFDHSMMDQPTCHLQAILNLLISQPPSQPTGIMIPIPQYPLYTATAAEYGLHPVSTSAMLG